MEVLDPILVRCEVDEIEIPFPARSELTILFLSYKEIPRALEAEIPLVVEAQLVQLHLDLRSQ